MSIQPQQMMENIIKMIPPESTNDDMFKSEFNGLELFNLSVDSIPYLLEPLIPTTCVFTIAGASDTGKSMLFRQMALHCVDNTPFLDFNFNSIHRKVIFVSTEDDHTATAFLLKKQAKAPQNLVNIRFKFDSIDIPEYLNRELSKDPADLIIIDAWSDVYGDNLNDSARIRQVLGVYKNIASRFNCAIGFLHHTGKRTESLEPSKNNIQGGQGYEAAMRLAIELRNDLEDSSYKHLCIVKGNYLSSEYKRDSYKLHFNDYDFTFSNTGERIPFDQLYTKGNTNTDKISKADLNDVHRSILFDIAKNAFKSDTFLSNRDLDTRLTTAYQNSGLKSKGGFRPFKAFLIDTAKVIKKIGKDRDPNVKYSLNSDISQSVSQ